MKKPHMDEEMKELVSNYKQAQLTQQTDKVQPLYRKTSNGAYRKTLTNLKIALSNMTDSKELGFNEFEGLITYGNPKEPIDDAFISERRLMIDHMLNVTFSKDDTLSMLDLVAKEINSYHPVKDFIESVEWDSVPRAETVFIDYLGAEDNDYTRAVARKWLAGAVARIYEPAIKFELVPVLEGKQGIGKSTLASKLGGEYFVDDLNTMGETKDDIQKMIGAWIIELGELSSLKKTDTDKIKNFISVSSDKVRLPYDRIPKDFKRTSVFIGTTNNTQFLTDLTGNRRFCPIPLTEQPKKDVFQLSDDTIHQIWAEAKTFYDKGEKLFLDEYESLIAEEYRTQASKEDMFFEDLEEFLNMKVPDQWESMKLHEKRTLFTRYIEDNHVAEDGKKIDRTTNKEIARVVYRLDGTQRESASTMAKINMYMNNLNGWERKSSIRINGRVTSGFVRKS